MYLTHAQRVALTFLDREEYREILDIECDFNLAQHGITGNDLAQNLGTLEQVLGLVESRQTEALTPQREYRLSSKYIELTEATIKAFEKPKVVQLFFRIAQAGVRFKHRDLAFPDNINEDTKMSGMLIALMHAGFLEMEDSDMNFMHFTKRGKQLALNLQMRELQRSDDFNRTLRECHLPNGFHDVWFISPGSLDLSQSIIPNN